MKENSTLIIAPALVILSLIPPGIYVYQYLNNGDLGWLMVWGNELVIWCAIFSVLAFLGLLVAIKRRATNPRTSIIVSIIATCVIAYSAFGLVTPGVTAASKADENELNLIGFWGSGWWK